MAVYTALGWTPTGSVAVKLSTGEPPNSNYLRPELIKDVVQAVDGTIVECNTAYGGSRAQTAMHYQVAKDHGFNDIADVVILDEKRLYVPACQWRHPTGRKIWWENTFLNMIPTWCCPISRVTLWQATAGQSNSFR